MAYVTRTWEGAGETRALVVKDVTGRIAEFRIPFADAVAKFGTLESAAEYGIRAILSDRGGKSAHACIETTREWLHGAPDPKAVLATLRAKEAEWHAERERMAAEMAALRERAAGR